jgi:hypothetical protein
MAGQAAAAPRHRAAAAEEAAGEVLSWLATVPLVATVVLAILQLKLRLEHVLQLA